MGWLEHRTRPDLVIWVIRMVEYMYRCFILSAQLCSFHHSADHTFRLSSLAKMVKTPIMTGLLAFGSTGPTYFVFCPPYPSSLQPPRRKCLAPTCHLSTLNLHCIAGAGLPILMIGEVSREPKRGRMWASHYLSPRCFRLSLFILPSREGFLQKKAATFTGIFWRHEVCFDY